MEQTECLRPSFRRKLVTAGCCFPLPPLREPRGEAFECTRRRFAPPFFLGCAAGGSVFLLSPYASKRGSKTRVGEQIFDLRTPGGEAFAYIRGRFSPPFPPLRRAPRGEAFEYIRGRIAPPFFYAGVHGPLFFV